MLKVKKLKPDRFFMSMTLRNTGCHHHGAHNFTCSPT